MAAQGTKSTGALTATTLYSLTCTGAGGTSPAAGATVTVGNANGPVTVSPTTATLAVGQTQQYTASVAGGGGVTWTVDGVAGGNAAVGQINAAGAYTAGTTPGSHTLVAANAVNGSLTATATAIVTNLAGVFTYHNDLGRDGANTQEFALNPGNVNTTSFGKLASCPVDGAIYGQPLWAPNLTVNGAKHNVVFVATQHDSVFAFDADASSCTVLWQASLVDAAHGGDGTETSVPTNLIGKGSNDIYPEIGVTSTPVIDPATGTLYVVSKSVDAGLNFFHRLHALDYTSGNERIGSPVTITASVAGTGDGGTTVAFNARQELQRPGLALVNGIVYIAWGSHEDAQPWYGWLMGYQYANNQFTQTAAVNTAPDGTLPNPSVAHTGGGAGIWMSGGAPAADAAGNVYVITGNGTFDANSATQPNDDYGDSLLQYNVGIGNSLSVGQYFTPPNQNSDYINDVDFGAGGTAVLADLPAGSPHTHLAMGGGKDSAFYVIDRDAMGGFTGTGVVQVIYNGPIYTTPAFWNNTVYQGTRQFPGTSGGPIYALQLDTATAQLSTVAQTALSFLFPGATPSISAMGTQNGIVWAIDADKYCTAQSPACGPAVLHAFNAANVATELWNSSQSGTDAPGNGIKFTVPTIANGKVYVGTRGNDTGGPAGSATVPGELDIYALKP